MGTTLVKTNGTPKTIADLTSIGEFGVESTDLDTTTLDSPNGYKESIAGMKDAGEITLSGIVKSPDNVEDLLGFAESQALHTWRVMWPDGDKVDFSAYVRSLKFGESTVDGLRTFSSTLRISGKPVLTVSGVSA